MQVEDRIGERAIGPQSVLDDHRRLFEHLLGGEGTGTATIGLGEGLFPFRPRILPDHRLEELHRLLGTLLLQRLGSPRGQGAKRGGRNRGALVGLLHSSVLPLARAVGWKVRDRKSRVAACGGWRDWACATRFVSRRRRKAQGITVGGLKSETPCASALFRGSWKRRRLCRSSVGCARQDGAQAQSRIAPAAPARILLVRCGCPSRFKGQDCANRDRKKPVPKHQEAPQLEGLLSGGAACPAARS